MAAKKIPFQLEMKNGFKVRDISQLKEYFDGKKVVGYFLDGKLQKWLESRWYEDELEAVSQLDKNDSLLVQHLCEIFGVEYEEEIINPEEIVEKNARIAKLKQYTEDEEILKNIDNVAFNQEELTDLYEKSVKKIYLCEGTFEITKSKGQIEYKLIGNAVIDTYLSSSNYNQIDNEVPQELLDYIGNKECVDLEDYIVWCDYDGVGPSSYDYDYKIVPFFKNKNTEKLDTLDRYKVWNKQQNVYSSLFKIGENGYRLGFQAYRNKIIYRDLDGICVYDVVSATRECVYSDLSYMDKKFSIDHGQLSFHDSSEKEISLDLNKLERIDEEIKQEECFDLELWKSIQDYVRKEYNLSQISFATWIEQIRIVGVQEKIIYLSAPVGIEYVEKKYGTVIKEAIDKFVKTDFKVLFVKES